MESILLVGLGFKNRHEGFASGLFYFFPSFLIRKRRKQLRAALRVPHGLEEERGSEDSTEHPVSPAGILQSREHGNGSIGLISQVVPRDGMGNYPEGGREEMEQGCTCCPFHGQYMATQWHWDESRGTVCATSLCVSRIVLGSSQALQLLRGDLHPALAPLMAPLHPGQAPQEEPRPSGLILPPRRVRPHRDNTRITRRGAASE